LKAQIRILVTGTRGKSSIVRGLKEVLCHCGISAWGKITGTEPLSLTPNGNYRIVRTSGAHVEEMRWWLNQLPKGAQAVIMENSAISADLQSLASKWLKPTLIIWTNSYQDHEEFWGTNKTGAVMALAKGIPKRSDVVCGPDVYTNHLALEILKDKRCNIIPVRLASATPIEISKSFIKEACLFLGIKGEKLEEALKKLRPSPHDFSIYEVGTPSTLIAFAFSANDIESTRHLWHELGWTCRETTLWFNHRKDRRKRLSVMKDFVASNPWRKVVLTGPYPIGAGFDFNYLGFASTEDVVSALGDRAFGCGNIAGIPLEVVKHLTRNTKELV